MILIDNQPVKFNEALNTCHHDFTHYKQLVNLGDVTQFQVKIGDCPLPENKITNGGFAATLDTWDFPAGQGWFWSNGKACNTSNGSTWLTQQTLIAGYFYRIEIRVSDLASTDTSNPYSGKIDIQLGMNGIGTIGENGIHVFYGVCLITDEFQIFKRPFTKVCIDDVIALEINIDHIVAIYNKDDVFITDLKVSDYITNLQAITDQFTLSQNFLTGFIDWSALAIPKGCYKICLLDSCINTNFQNYLPNGEFNVSASSPFVKWAFSSIYVFTGLKQMWFSGAAPLATGNATQTGIKSGCAYEITIKINAISDAKVWVQLGTNQTTQWTTAGTFTETITSNGTTIGIYFEGTDPIANPQVRLEFVRLRIDSACYQADYCSPIFALEQNHDCTLRINACNNPRAHDDMGFYFQYTNFTPTVRVKGKLVNSRYDLEREIEDDSTGKRKVIFYQRRKKKRIKIEKQPEYIHDFLSLLHGFDHFYIGDVEYVVQSDEYEPRYSHEDNYARVELDLTEKVELIRNTLCLSELEGGCQIDDVLIEPLFGEMIVLSGSDEGEPILIPNG